jgi:proliferating cell nuclear antigen
MTELQLFDSPGAEVAEITTNGNVIKPFLNAIAEVDSEAKINVTEHGLECDLVDRTNVFMTSVFLSGDAFEEYQVSQEQKIGVPIKELQKTVRRARKNHDDQLTLSIQERELTATVARGYENHDVVSQGTMKLIDPDSIREEPEVPDLEHSISVSVDYEPFTDAVGYALGAADHISLAVKGVNQHTNALYIGSETDTRDESAAITNIESDATAESLYSADYVGDIVNGIDSINPSSVDIRFDDEFPVFFDVEREVIPMQAQYVMAPRVRSE